MTHSLHRQGTEENLKNDFALMILPQFGYNHEFSNLKAKRFLEIIKKYDPDNYGVITLGNKYTHSDEEVINALDTAPCIFCIVTSKESLTAIFKDLKEEDMGISIVVNGVYCIIQECCREAGLEPHTVNHSVGIWGRTEKLPSNEVLEVITMCGHGQVSAHLVEELVRRVRDNKMTLRDAAVELAKPCVCGFFNTQRAELLMKGMIKE